MDPSQRLGRALDRDIEIAHERFVEAVGARLPELPLETKERYFAVLSLLVSKLEAHDKTLGDVIQEMIAEAAGHLFQELGSSR
jgi:RNA processing factor Prp31